MAGTQTFIEKMAGSIRDQEITDSIENESKPVDFASGTSLFTSFKIQKNEREIFRILEEHFGEEDGSYFVIADSIFSRYVNGKNSRFKVVKVEDKNHYKYMLWFDITNLSLILNVL